MTDDAVRAFLQTYVDAFARGDVDAVAACWRFPATISTPAGEVILDEPDFRENTHRLCDFYRRQGMAEARCQLSGMQSLSDAVASIVTDYELLDSQGRRIVAWRNGYLLRESGGDAIHAVAAVADAEIEAWAARGTPFLEAEVEGEPMLRGVIPAGGAA